MSTTPLTRGDKVRATFKAKRARGEVTGRVPLGYKVVYDECGHNPRKVVDPDVMPLVLEAKALHNQGMSIRKVAQAMVAKGLTGRDGKALRPASLWRILEMDKNTKRYSSS